MAYERHNWSCREVVTAERLNNIEDGIEEALECCDGGSLVPCVVHITEDGTCNGDPAYVTDKSYQDMLTAGTSGALPIFLVADSEEPTVTNVGYLSSSDVSNGLYYVGVECDRMNDMTFIASSATGVMHTECGVV